ncbi:MAG: phosphoadenylyl-sulfate reductase [Fimbriimonadaceae bacterium]|nr:phosphoadenylyl-sulfate reductase [Fimbriimonadaceae bacterium]
MPTEADVAVWQGQWGAAPAGELLAWAASLGGGPLAVACSFSLEDCVVVDLLVGLGLRPRVFALDTGRLPEETYRCAEQVTARYGLSIAWYFPLASAVEALLGAKGAFSFRESLANRHECCGIRKVEPLRRALQGATAWVTGQRRAQSVTRGGLAAVEWDAANGGLLKLNPLAAWTRADVEAYAAEQQVPVHPLHQVGYPSIGCLPCTRAVEPGEDERAGRWWWEAAEHKECGLHARPVIEAR